MLVDTNQFTQVLTYSYIINDVYFGFFLRYSMLIQMKVMTHDAKLTGMYKVLFFPLMMAVRPGDFSCLEKKMKWNVP